MTVLQFPPSAPTPRRGHVSVWEYVCALQDAAQAEQLSSEEEATFVCHALLDALEEDAAFNEPAFELARAA